MHPVYWLNKKTCPKCHQEKFLLDFAARNKKYCKECLRKKPIIDNKGYAGNSFGLNLRTGGKPKHETDC